MGHGAGRRSAIIAALPSWYVDLTDERPLVIKRIQMPVINGIVNVRLQPRRPGQVLGALLVVVTYPALLLVSVIGPLFRFVRSVCRLLVRVSDLQPPQTRSDVVTREASIERVNQSVERVGRMLAERLSTLDGGHSQGSMPTRGEPGHADCR